MESLRSGARRLGATLTSEQLDKFELYFTELNLWNQRTNLTRIVARELVETHHFLDSLTASIGLPEGPFSNLRFLDVGSGAGFPGIPLQILYRETNLTLLEATNKKARFLEHVVQMLDLENTSVVCARAEDLGRDTRHREAYDVVLARAVATLTTLVELTLPFAIVGGRVIAHKRGNVGKEIGDSSFAVRELGGRMNQTRPVRLPELNDNDRLLVIIDKIAPTGLAYPRRSGIPRKRPLKAA